MKTKTTSLLSYNLDQSARAFAAQGAMSAAEFIDYAHDYLYEGSECLFDNITQCASEIAMFGDSGPGSMLRLGEQVGEYNRVADRYTALTGNVVHRPRMPSYPVSYDYDEDQRF